MKKKILFIGLLLILFSSVYAQTIEKRSEHFVAPTVGFGAPGVNVGVDYTYRHSSGFAVFCNANFSIPIARMAGIIFHPEIYLGYSMKRGNFYVSFGAGVWGGGGIAFYGYGPYSGNTSGINFVEVDFGMLGIRNDYMYFFNEKMGLSFSHTHGLGIYFGRWFMDDQISYYNMQVKLGLAFRF